MEALPAQGEIQPYTACVHVILRESRVLEVVGHVYLTLKRYVKTEVNIASRISFLEGEIRTNVWRFSSCKMVTESYCHSTGIKEGKKARTKNDVYV